jgi:hypothetical protein
MPKNTPMQTPQPQQVRAIIATTIVVLVLAAVAGLSFWYGRKDATNTNTASTNNSAQTDSTATQTPAKEAAIVGTIKQVLGDSIELSTGTGETTTTVKAMITSATSLRKLDYRNVPKQGLGDGVAISKSDLKTGATVVVRTADASSSQVQASKVSLLIYR